VRPLTWWPLPSVPSKLAPYGPLSVRWGWAVAVFFAVVVSGRSMTGTTSLLCRAIWALSSTSPSVPPPWVPPAASGSHRPPRGSCDASRLASLIRVARGSLVAGGWGRRTGHLGRQGWIGASPQGTPRAVWSQPQNTRCSGAVQSLTARCCGFGARAHDRFVVHARGASVHSGALVVHAGAMAVHGLRAGSPPVVNRTGVLFMVSHR